MPTPLQETQLIVNGRYREQVVRLINGAKSSIDILMFEWKWYKKDVCCDATLINQAILRAKKRGVRIRGIVNHAKQMQELLEVGLTVRTNEAGTVLHSKCLIFDDKIVVMGSHNLTQNAMRSNIETSVIIHSENFAKEFGKYFESLWLS